MNKYTKALTAILTAVLSSLTAFGVTVPPEVVPIATSVIGTLGAVLVYWLPNATE